ncbi:MAG: LysR family transcriptional regulator ArgP [Sulfitobacter sp.]
MQIDPTQLAALSAILRLGSFDAAAGALNVTPSAISQRLKALEERVGTSLVHRNHPCTPTPLGARLAKHAENIALLERDALGDLAQTESTLARLTLAVPADCLATWLLPAFAAAPDLLYDLAIDDQDTADEWLKRGAVSAAVTGYGQAVRGCDLYPLGSMRYIATASPAFMHRYFPNGVTPSALARAPMLTFTAKDQLQSRWITQKTGKTLHPPNHLMPSTHAFVDATRHGLAWGMNPESLVADHIVSGELVALDSAAPLDVPLFWQVTRIMAPALTKLTEAIRATALKHLRKTAENTDNSNT